MNLKLNTATAIIKLWTKLANIYKNVNLNWISSQTKAVTLDCAQLREFSSELKKTELYMCGSKFTRKAAQNFQHQMQQK